MAKASGYATAVSVDPEVLGGQPCFTGTRVPVASLWDHLEAGDPLDAFLAQFPTVGREQAVAVIERARERLHDDAVAAG